MKSKIILIVFFLMVQNVFCQTENIEIITHKVALGETMLMISKKYLVNPAEIYKLNKNAIDGISAGMVLKIPQPIKSQEIIAEHIKKKENEKAAEIKRIESNEEQNLSAKKEVITKKETEEEKGRRENINKLSISNKKKFIDHVVISGETLTSLSKRYGISVEDIEKDNEKALMKGLQIGQTLKIQVSDKLLLDTNENKEQLISEVSSKELNTSETINPNKDLKVSEEANTIIKHKVVQGETLYAISRKYNIPVDVIQKQNESLLKNGLMTGQEILIKQNNNFSDSENSLTAAESNQELNKTDNGETIIIHEVKPKETLYGISKKYNVSIEEIQTQNQSLLKNGLQIGQKISIRLKK